MSAELSAEISALKQAARQREETGFTTMSVQTLDLRSEDKNPWATVSTSVVGSGALYGTYIVAYSGAKELRGVSVWDLDVPVRQPQLIRSDTFLVRREGNAASVSGGEVVFADFGGRSERGVIVVDVPRKVISSEQVSFYTANLKRKTPRVVLGGRNRDEGSD